MLLTASEIAPGLVVRLDTTVLRARGDSQTNAVVSGEDDRAVSGTHDFLVVGVDRPTGRCTAVPLFAKAAVGSQPLAEEHKAGPADGWLGAELYFSRWQHWRIPAESLVAASSAEPTAEGDRRRYAAGDGATLDDIRAWESRNRAAYRRT
jgi:hypothetical protein